MKNALRILFGLIAASLLILGAILMINIGNNKQYSEPLLIEHVTKGQQMLIGLGMIICGAMFYVFVALFPWPWLRRRICTDCNENKTPNIDGERLDLCVQCKRKHLEKKLLGKASSQPLLNCPFDGEVMGKFVLSESEIVIDKCKKCGCVILEKDEIKELEQRLKQPRPGQSFSGGRAIAIGHSHMH